MAYYQQGLNNNSNANIYTQQNPGNGFNQLGVQQNSGFFNSENTESSNMPTGSMQTSLNFNETSGEHNPNQLSKGLLAAFSTSGYPGEPPLLEELGVNFGHIKGKTLAVLGFKSRSISEDVIQDSDLAGPILFCLLFGILLLLSGKTHFGYIYGIALFGTISLHLLFRLMSNNSGPGGLDLLRTASVLGYCLLPLVLLSALAVVHDLDNTFGYVLGIIAIFWCTYSSSAFFVRVLQLTNARLLVAYPLAMFYSVFALMAIFVEKKV